MPDHWWHQSASGDADAAVQYWDALVAFRLAPIGVEVPW